MARNDLADDERFTTNAGRVENRKLLDEAIAAWCAQHDLQHVQEVADAAGIGNARYNLPSEVLVHPQLTARNRWRQIETPVGPIPALLPPPVISGFDPPKGAIPGLGQHTDSVLAELGLVLPVLAQHVAGRDVGQVEVLAQACRLRALARAGRAEEDQVQLAHFRKPS